MASEQHLRDPAEAIDETGHAGVRRAHHRTPGFDTAKDRVRKMLLARPPSAQEPAVVRHVGEQVRAAQNKLPGQLAERVLEADEWRDLHLVGR